MPEPDDNSIRGIEKERDKQYTAAFASPYRRFVSYIIDSMIIYSFITLTSFFIVRDEIREEVDKINEINITSNTEQNNEATGDVTIVNIDKNSNDIIEKKFNAMESIIVKKLIKNKFFRYTALLFPVFYYIIFLYYKQRTFGESLMNLIVVRGDGQKLESVDIISRVFLFMISKNLFIAPVAIILPIFSTKNKITLYDFFSNSYVIEVLNA